MFRFIIIAAISTMFFTGSAVAGEGGHHYHYGYGYAPNYGRAYIPPSRAFYPAQQPYYGYAPHSRYYGYGQSMPMQAHHRGHW